MIDKPSITVKRFSPAAEFKDSLADGSSVVGVVRVMVSASRKQFKEASSAWMLSFNVSAHQWPNLRILHFLCPTGIFVSLPLLLDKKKYICEIR